MNIFLPSLANMTEYFQTDYAVMQLSVSAYLAVNAVIQILVGPISDRYGRRPVVLWCIAIFSLATLGCMLSTTVEMFLFFRMVQSVISIGLVLSRAIVRDIVPADKAASMIGYVTMGMAVVPMFAPAIGGLLDEAFGWQANFAFLLVFAIIGFGVMWGDLGETNQAQSTSFRAQFREYPHLFRSQRFWGYSLAAAFASGSFFAFLGGAAFVATDFFKLDPSTLGIYFGMTAFGYMLGNFISGRFSVRVGINRMMFGGAVVSIASILASLAMIWAGSVHPLAYFFWMVPLGAGNGMVMPNANAGMVSVRPHLAGTASGLGGAIFVGGGAALSALAGALLYPGSGPYPLLFVQGGVTVLLFGAIYWIVRVERIRGPLDATGHESS